MNSTASLRADAVRRFNRFYTAHLGVLNDQMLDTGFSLTESRALYELGAASGRTSTELRQLLRLDAGYLSRIIAGFEHKGLIVKTRSAEDARAFHLSFSESGQTTLAELEQAARGQITLMLERLPDAGQNALVQAMEQIQRLLGHTDHAYLLRDPRPGDMGRVVQQQAELYAREYGWNAEFEALLAELVAQYLKGLDPARERCWIAERNGQVIGSIFVVRHDATTAKLRMLYVDASARGLGIGKRLVDETLHFARGAGYQRMLLWTMSVLADARRLYQNAGFELIGEEAVHSFGQDLVSQTWSRDL